MHNINIASLIKKLSTAAALTVLVCLRASAQMDWHADQAQSYDEDSLDQGLYLNWYSQGYFKNNEYFLPTASGYTLFGHQHIPSLIYRPNKFVHLQAGIYLQKDFGNVGFARIAPYYLLQLQKNGYSLAFGNIAGHVHHRMYDPLYAYERMINHHLEEGLSMKVEKGNIYSETWIDWQRMQYPHADYNERFVVGHHTDLKIYDNESWSFSVPLQALATHSGGQLDTTSLPTSTIVNASLGLRFDALQNDAGKDVSNLYFNLNYMLFRDLAKNAGLPYTKGNALYANLGLRYRNDFGAHLGYWRGEQFIAPQGDILFSALSVNPNNPALSVARREMIILGLSYEKRIADFCGISLRVQPFYDLSFERIDYYWMLSLNVQPNIKLWSK